MLFKGIIMVLLWILEYNDIETCEIWIFLLQIYYNTHKITKNSTSTTNDNT